MCVINWNKMDILDLIKYSPKEQSIVDAVLVRNEGVSI